MKKILMLCCTTAMLLGGRSRQQSVLQPEPKKKNPVRSVSLSFTGDILMEDTPYNWMGKGYSFKSYFGKVTPYLGNDLTIGNQEVVPGDRELGITGNSYTLNTSEEIAEQLPKVDFGVSIFANNHSYDRDMQEIVNI